MNKEDFITKLKSITENFENDIYDEKTKQYISQFIINIDFINQINNNTIPKSEFLKFLSLGWYIYSNLQTV
jgi:hypothetical protein